MRSAESPQLQSVQKHQSHNQLNNKQHQHQHHRTTSSGDAATGRSSARHHGKHQQRLQHQHQSRRHCGGSGGCGDCGEDCAGSQQQLPAPPSLIDQLLINSVSAAKGPTAASSAAAAAVSTSSQKQRHGSFRHRQQQQHQPIDPSVSISRSAVSHCPEDATVTGVAGNPETAAGKALARQWDVSKQFVIATLINCLSHRMRDLQRTEDLGQACEKLAVLGQLRRLMESIRGLDLVKAIYSDRKRAKLAEAAVGLRHRTVPTDMLRKWSSRENEYHLYWMALLEKSVANLAQCQESVALRCQLEFALALVDVRGFPA